MTQERFLKLLDNPDLLATISYEELKTLALSYPFAHNLRYLLAIKSNQENHPDSAKNLATASAYSLDRTRLFHLIAPKKFVPVSVPEEQVLELKPIETVQRELESRVPVARSQEMERTPASAAVPVPPRSSEPERKVPDLDFSDPGMGALPDASESAPRKPVAALPDSVSFAEWMSQFNVPTIGQPEFQKPADAADVPLPMLVDVEPDALREESAGPELPETDEKTLVAQKLAEKSVRENKDIVSETLARLYIRQGYREKAIDMFERLCLAFPEKCAYFAAEIDKLKK